MTGGKKAIRTVGVFQTGMREWDLWFPACEGACGHHRGLEFRPYDYDADHIFLLGNLLPRFGGPKLPYIEKKKAKIQNRLEARELELVIEHIGRDRDDLSMLVYEPVMFSSDEWFRVANKLCSRVYAPDSRAGYPITLPATWSFPEHVAQLRKEEPSDDLPIDLACITSGKVLWDGHSERLDFLRMLREAGVRVALFGRGLPADLADHPDSYGPVQSKAAILRGTRFTLAIENDSSNDQYLSEKLWDPLLCWSLPLYYGSKAADSLIPNDAFIRVPDLSHAGVDAVKAALAKPGLRDERLGAIGESRQRALGDLRITEWVWKMLQERSG